MWNHYCQWYGRKVKEFQLVWNNTKSKRSLEENWNYFFYSRVNSVRNKVTKLPVIHFIPKLQKNLSKVWKLCELWSNIKIFLLMYLIMKKLSGSKYVYYFVEIIVCSVTVETEVYVYSFSLHGCNQGKRSRGLRLSSKDWFLLLFLI